MAHDLAAISMNIQPGADRPEVVLINPVYRELLAALSLNSACDFLHLEGDIVSGHPDRHVMRVRIGAVDTYLKREHHVPWGDRLASWRAGFGWISVSLREAAALQSLRASEIATPDWIAAGESADGRAFLVLRSIGPAVDLRRFLHDRRNWLPRERRSFARRLAHEVADIHNRGFEYPDLYAKHILIDAEQERVTFIDWQRSRKRKCVSWRSRCRGLAALNASLADDLVDPAERLAFLLAYYRAADTRSIRFERVCRLIERRTRRLLGRTSIHEQRRPTLGDSQPLLWLDGEALCVTPMGRSLFDRDRLCELAYPNSGLPFQERRIELPNRDTAILACRSTNRRIGAIVDILRRRSWTSPEARAAAALLRQERLGERPRLLAFGQRQRGWRVVESFLLAMERSPD